MLGVMRPLFSIVVPTMGRLSLWKRALTSVLEQDFDDFEIIAVNSHHTPESGHLIASFKSPRILYLMPPQSDAPLNWDIGYRRARGKYILWLDDDNYLLPHALRTLAAVIAGHDPDIATGDHVHWYHPNYPEVHLRNAVSIPLPLFTGTVSPVNPAGYLASLFGMREPKAPRARFHFTETAIRKEFLEKLLAETGPIDFRDSSPRYLQSVLLASGSARYADSPIAIVIQMADSMAYRWSKKGARKIRFAVQHHLSPVSADTYINYVTDNLLRAKHSFPDIFSPYEVNWPSFYRTYARELIFLDQDLGDLIATWRELAKEVRRSEVSIQLLPSIGMAVGIFLLKRLGLYGAARALVKKRTASSKKNSLVALAGRGVHTIRDCAREIPSILAEMGARY